MSKRKPIEIGDRTFKYKKDALAHYKKILNSYDFGEVLEHDDFVDVYELLRTHPRAKEKIGPGIEHFQIGKAKYGTKCFEFLRKDSTIGHFGYVKSINGERKPITKFSRACRRIIQADLRSAKQQYFDKNSKQGHVKCQETGELLPWEGLNIDHRQPNTFSVIVDRFIEVNDIDINNAEYISAKGYGQELADKDMAELFREYHKEKANLRLVEKDLNQGRSYQARINPQKKDLKI